MTSLYRVSLLIAAICAQAGSPHPACGSVTTPQHSLRALGGRPIWVPVCSRRGVNGSAPWFDSVSTSVMDQQACISPAWGTVTALKLAFAAFDMPQQGEVDRTVTATGTAAIFVPGANQVSVVGGAGVAAGSTTLNVFPGSGLGVNGISLGQIVTSAGGGIAPGTYVTAVANSFVPGSGNLPNTTTVTISAATTAATASGQTFVFGGQFLPVRFGGKRNFTVEPSHDVVTSDPVGVELPPNTAFMVRTSANMSGVGMQLMDVPVSARLTINSASGSFTEFSNRGTTPNDQTMTPAGLSNSGGGYWGPVSLLALVTPQTGQVAPGAVLVLGDSIAAGTGDSFDTLGLEGYIQRSLENNMPFVTAARGSTTAFGLLSHGDGQYALSVETGITDILLELGRNDIELFSITAAQLEQFIQSVATRYVLAGKRVWCFTVPPSTYSNDAWSTLANQSFPYTVNVTGSGVTSAGATQITMASVANIAAGQSVGLNGSSDIPAQAIAPGTAVVSVNQGSSAITISTPTAGALAAGTRLYFGVQQAASSPIEVQRGAYNAYVRGIWRGNNPYCAGVVDDDSVFADQGGSAKWRVDLGQPSIDGVHPSAALHSAAVSAGIISPAMFSIP